MNSDDTHLERRKNKQKNAESRAVELNELRTGIPKKTVKICTRMLRNRAAELNKLIKVAHTKKTVKTSTRMLEERAALRLS